MMNLEVLLCILIAHCGILIIRGIKDLLFRDNGVEEATEADCFLIVKYFDSDDDGNLNFQDFLQIFMPCDNHYLRAIIA